MVERFVFSFDTGKKWPLCQKKHEYFHIKYLLIKHPSQTNLGKELYPPAFSSMDTSKAMRFPNDCKTQDRCQIINEESCTQSNYCIPILKDTVPILQNNAAFSKKMPLSLLTTGT